MLIEFTVGNYLSFKEKRTFSMEATSIKENGDNVFEAGGHRLLKGGVIYGANASGKSNLIKAMRAFEKLIMASRKLSSTDEIEVTPFRLSTETEHKPSFFEMVFLVDGRYYRYGFEVTRKAVVREWLFHKTRGERMLFLREGQEIEIDRSLAEFSVFKDKVNSNVFFLTVLDHFNETNAQSIIKYLNISFEAALAVSDFYRALTVFTVSINSLANLIVRSADNEVVQLLKSLNLGFEEFTLNPKSDLSTVLTPLTDRDGNVLPKSSEHPMLLQTIHNVFDDKGNLAGSVKFDLDKDESTGAKKVMDMLGVLIITLKQGGFFAMDEMDANLHPILTQRIIELFHSPVTNPKNAQLVLTTHDTNLLSYGNYRRDQIWFTEKDSLGATDLYSLAEFKLDDGKKVRSDASYESQYLEGRYGAIPFIGNVEKILGHAEEV
jgi:uncharacterized protein